MLGMVLVVNGELRAKDQQPIKQGFQSAEVCEQKAIDAEEVGNFKVARILYEASCQSNLDLNPDFQGNQEWVRVNALYRLGNLLRKGRGGPTNAARAAKCFVLALGIGANERSAGAWVNLIEMYRRGEGIPKDIKFARHLYQELEFHLGASTWSDEDLELGHKYLRKFHFARAQSPRANADKHGKHKVRAWKGSSLTPPPDDLDESKDEEFHQKASEQTNDPVKSLFHKLYARYLAPGCWMPNPSFKRTRLRRAA